MPETSLPAVSNSDRSTTQVPVFGCIVRRSGLDVEWIHAMGEVDLAAAPRLEQALREAEMCPRVLDLRDVTSVICAGVHAILAASERARVSRARLVLLRGPSHVDRLFALTGTAGSLEIVDLRAFEPPISALVQSAVNDGRLLPRGHDQ